ncbi:hypothetical protein GUJ93_ZPchr0007g4442 [Zizania palustris]|uniref:Uncharacterized protein n=1 Tax=Zizania palustris TaxID=103762 RepID=A0A8J5VN17_ZIZPA|nr:hypothetical protein GUJ93_ZPchr0007g4442 [Zizania palustris]
MTRAEVGLGGLLCAAEQGGDKNQGEEEEVARWERTGMFIGGGGVAGKRVWWRAMVEVGETTLEFHGNVGRKRLRAAWVGDGCALRAWEAVAALRVRAERS